MSVLLKLREARNLTDSEQKISEYLLQNYKDISKYDAKLLAKKGYTSIAGVTRFCKKIGFKGFTDFKIKLIEESAIISNNDISLFDDIDISKDDTIQSIITKLNKISVDTLNETKILQDVDSIQKIVEELKKVEVIDFYGMGASHIVALDANYKFMRAGKITNVYALADHQYVQAKNSNKNHIAVIFSYSGETPEMINIAKVLVKNNVKIIAITKNSDNPISKLADYNIYVASKEKLERSSAVYSRLSMLNVIDILFFSYFSSTYDESMSNINNNRVKK